MKILDLWSKINNYGKQYKNWPSSPDYFFINDCGISSKLINLRMKKKLRRFLAFFHNAPRIFLFSLCAAKRYAIPRQKKAFNFLYKLLNKKTHTMSQKKQRPKWNKVFHAGYAVKVTLNNIQYICTGICMCTYYHHRYPS